MPRSTRRWRRTATVGGRGGRPCTHLRRIVPSVKTGPHADTRQHGGWNPSTNVRPARPPRPETSRPCRPPHPLGRRVAVEHQPVTEWQDEALAEKDPQAALTALCALARHGDKALRGSYRIWIVWTGPSWISAGGCFASIGSPSFTWASRTPSRRGRGKLDAVYPARFRR